MWEQVKADEVDLLLQRIFGGALECIGFQPSSRRRWCRSRVPGMRDLFEVAALKGATLSPRWGFSLDYAPHLTPGGVNGLGFYNYVQSPMALAFTLARVGRLEDARKELREAYAYAAATPIVRSRLDALLGNAIGVKEKA
jgi:hypothetical protein